MSIGQNLMDLFAKQPKKQKPKVLNFKNKKQDLSQIDKLLEQEEPLRVPPRKRQQWVKSKQASRSRSRSKNGGGRKGGVRVKRPSGAGVDPVMAILN